MARRASVQERMVRNELRLDESPGQGHRRDPGQLGGRICGAGDDTERFAYPVASENTA